MRGMVALSEKPRRKEKRKVPMQDKIYKETLKACRPTCVLSSAPSSPARISSMRPRLTLLANSQLLQD